MMSGNDFDGVQYFEKDANDENASPNLQRDKPSLKSPRSYKKLLVSDHNSPLPTNAASYLLKVG